MLAVVIEDWNPTFSAFKFSFSYSNSSYITKTLDFILSSLKSVALLTYNLTIVDNSLVSRACFSFLSRL